MLEKIKGIEIEDLFYPKNQIMSMSLSEFNIFISFIEDIETIDTLSRWHLDDIVPYSEKSLKTLDFV